MPFRARPSVAITFRSRSANRHIGPTTKPDCHSEAITGLLFQKRGEEHWFDVTDPDDAIAVSASSQSVTFSWAMVLPSHAAPISFTTDRRFPRPTFQAIPILFGSSKLSILRIS